MKLFLSMFFVIIGLGIFVHGVVGQSVESNLTVIEKKWRIDVRNHSHDKDPLKEIKGREEEVREFVEVQRQNEIRVKQGLPPLPPPIRRPSYPGQTGVEVNHVYEVRVKNNAKRSIRKVIWEYVFFEPETGREIGRRYFESEVAIRPGKSKKILETAAFSPTSTIDANDGDKGDRSVYSELIFIQTIEYTDGTIWRAVSKPTGKETN